MKDMYFTITGCNHYLGNEFMEKGMKVKLKKEPDNEFDSEAIMVQIKGMVNVVMLQTVHLLSRVSLQVPVGCMTGLVKQPRARLSQL